MTFDRANWKFAHIDINILTLEVAHQGAAHPTVWLTMSEAGNYSTEEQITLREIFFDLFGKERIKSLTCHFGFDEENWSVANNGISVSCGSPLYCRRSPSFT